jgi:hypothetical protein
MIITGLLLLVGIAVVLMFSHIARKCVLGVREEIPDAKLVELFSSSSLSAEATLALLKQIGACYGIAYSQLRPDDCFITRLSKVDSWRFDAGAEKLEKWLRDNLGIAIPDGLKTFTILDLLKLIEGSGRIAGKSG